MIDLVIGLEGGLRTEKGSDLEAICNFVQGAIAVIGIRLHNEDPAFGLNV